MPLYEYACEKCRKNFEIIKKFSDPEVSTCPSCGSEVKRQLSRTSFQLRGTGWYATDYKSSGSSPSGSGSSEGSGE